MTAGRIILIVALATTAVLDALYCFGAAATSFAPFDTHAVEELLIERGSLMLFWLGLGYFWLALGYFEHGRSISRNTAALQKATQDAAAALEIVEVEAHRQRHYHRTRVQAAQPRWEVNGCVAHKGQCEISVRNVGAATSNLAVWKRELPVAVMLSNATFVNRGQDLTIKVIFSTHTLDHFDLRLEYCDAAGDPRFAEIKVANAAATIQHEEV